MRQTAPFSYHVCILNAWTRNYVSFWLPRVALFLAFCFWAARFNTALTQAPRFAADPQYQLYGRVDWWLLSAQCTQKSGVFLGACAPDGHFEPIENISLAEDRGHNLLVNFVAATRREPLTRVTLTRIQMAINAFGVLILAGVLASAGLVTAAALLLWMGAFWGVPGPLPGPDVPSSFFGIFALAMAPAAWAAAWSRISRVSIGFWIAGGVSFVALAATHLLRQPMGIGAVVLTASFLVVAARRRPERAQRIAAWVGLVLVVLTLRSNAALLGLRNQIWPMAPSRYILTHGIYHNLYIGLGTEPNPWDIHYDNDAYGLRDAHKVDPTVEFCTPRYFAILRDLYLGLLKEEPGTILKIYARKIYKVWNSPFLFWRIPVRYYLLLMLIAWPWLWRIDPSKDAARKWIAGSFVLSTLFLALQGVLAKPVPMFLYPIKLGILLPFFVLADALFQRVLRRDSPDSTPQEN
jgi:hypothetical protein